MRVVVFVKATVGSEAGEMPSPELMEAMGRYNEELIEAGIVVGGDGLKPSSCAKRVTFSGKDRTVYDGPFAETKELISGFWVWEVRDMEEAVEWVKRCPHPEAAEDAEMEIRPVVTMEDFGEAVTAEAAAIHTRNAERSARR